LPNEASLNFWDMRKPKKTAPKLRAWTSIDPRVARGRRRCFQIRGIETETAALALVGWIAFAAIVNAQPEPGRLPESDSESAYRHLTRQILTAIKYTSRVISLTYGRMRTAHIPNKSFHVPEWGDLEPQRSKPCHTQRRRVAAGLPRPAVPERTTQSTGT
jgi:hypothetical protein